MATALLTNIGIGEDMAWNGDKYEGVWDNGQIINVTEEAFNEVVRSSAAHDANVEIFNRYGDEHDFTDNDAPEYEAWHEAYGRLYQQYKEHYLDPNQWGEEWTGVTMLGYANKPAVPYSDIVAQIKQSSQSVNGSPYIQRNAEGDQYSIDDDGGQTNLYGNPFHLYNDWVYLSIPTIDYLQAMHDAKDGMSLSDGLVTEEVKVGVLAGVASDFGLYLDDEDAIIAAFEGLDSYERSSRIYDALPEDEQLNLDEQSLDYYAEEAADEFTQSDEFQAMFEVA